MKSRIGTIVSIFLVLSGLVMFVVACSEAQWKALQNDSQGLAYTAGTTNTKPTVYTSTQPTTQDLANQQHSDNFLDTARTIYNITTGSNTMYATVGGIIGLVAAGVSAYASNRVTKTAVTAQLTQAHNSVLTEVGSAIVSVLPGAWTSKANEALKAAGLHDLADPTTTTAVVNTDTTTAKALDVTTPASIGKPLT